MNISNAVNLEFILKLSNRQQLPSQKKISPLVLLMGRLATPVISALRLAARVSPIFNNKIRETADKFYFIFIDHPILRPRPTYIEPPLLCSTLNVTTPSVAWRGADICRAKKIIETLDCSTHFQECSRHLAEKGITYNEFQLKNKIKEIAVRGSVTEGICIGASIFVIKELLKKNPQSEEELVACLEPYNEGFPEEAAALQEATAVFQKSYYEVIGQDLESEVQKSLVIEQAPMQAKMCALLAGMEAECINNKALVSEKERDGFDQLENGYYVLSFFKHAVNYFKTNFGSYLLDPNFGLIRCNAEKPFETLQFLVKKYYSGSLPVMDIAIVTITHIENF